jgi:Zn finger protein HypA/HybF involved in hydrogenase expression
MTIIKCNDCETLYEKDDINIVECLYCKSDEYLTESEEIK